MTGASIVASQLMWMWLDEWRHAILSLDEQRKGKLAAFEEACEQSAGAYDCAHEACWHYITEGNALAVALAMAL